MEVLRIHTALSYHVCFFRPTRGRSELELFPKQSLSEGLMLLVRSCIFSASNSIRIKNRMVNASVKRAESVPQNLSLSLVRDIYENSRLLTMLITLMALSTLSNPVLARFFYVYVYGLDPHG